jgi:hypothetical protein
VDEKVSDLLSYVFVFVFAFLIIFLILQVYNDFVGETPFGIINVIGVLSDGAVGGSLIP